METKFNVTGGERKRLVAVISEIFKQPTHYQGAPSFAYQIGAYTVDKNGALTFDSTPVDPDALRGLLDTLKEHGFEAEDSDFLSIGYPLEGFSEDALDNLDKLITSKAPLIKKALGIDNLPVERTGTELAFPWFRAGQLSEEVYAYARFITVLCKTAKEKKRITAKPRDSFENERFAMRVWLIGLGLSGEEYKLTRKLILQNLSGNAAWRYGAPGKKPVTSETYAMAENKIPEMGGSTNMNEEMEAKIDA